MGAKLPTAWDIVVDLAQQLCRPDDPGRAELLTPANVEDWYVVSEHMNTEEDQWIAPVAQRLSDDPARLAPLQSLATEVPDDRRDPTLPVALAGAQTYFHLSANRIADSYVGVGVATVMPQELWLDESKPGAVRI
ncbi:hypothetical protein [Gordonia sp. SCSIO 19800]|uniref:hypothetical protein n=1 Tax=Gordonia sp. SCSIO 19800 TaxID=2826926 RepID=UPI001B8298AF|nr:hypothetical protein [Gordonia sp. SCSIO 19800]MBR7194662.1 hypothetical protein [Gordonia sp. SCSIO 19800]